MNRRIARGLGLSAILVLLSACNSKSSTPTAPSGPRVTVAAVTVSGTVPAIGSSSQFTATASLADGASANVTGQATWQSSNPAVLSISASGVVTAVSAGSAEVSATYQGVTGRLAVVVNTLPCTFDVQPRQLIMPAGGGSATITVTVLQGSSSCGWTAQSNSTFVTITSGASGTGSGSVTVAVSSNGSVARTGSLTIAGTAVDLTQQQADCVTAVSPTTHHFNGGGGTATVSVTAPAGCAWTFVNTTQHFVTVISGGSGVGSGSVSFRVLGNATGAPRSATLWVEGFQILVSQDVPTGTYLVYTSDPGDYIGQGMPYATMVPAGTFTWTVSAATDHVSIQVISSDGLQTYNWNLDLQAPNGQPLLVGNYPSATRWPFQAPSVPGLSFWGTGRGCNQLSGSFVVLEAVYGPGPTLSSFYATFEQHCEGAVAALRGEISINR